MSLDSSNPFLGSFSVVPILHKLADWNAEQNRDVTGSQLSKQASQCNESVPALQSDATGGMEPLLSLFDEAKPSLCGHISPHLLDLSI
jgi:hypothetical protein